MIMAETGLTWGRASYVLDMLGDATVPRDIELCDVVSAAQRATSKAELRRVLLQDCEICLSVCTTSMVGGDGLAPYLLSRDM